MKILKNESSKKHKKRKTKKKWTEEEDKILMNLIKSKKIKKWETMATFFENRKGKQLRERWLNHLDPKLSKIDWKVEEEWYLFLYQKLLGNKWATISKIFTNRSENSCKNHFNIILKTNTDFVKKFENKIADYLSMNFEKLEPREKNIFDVYFKFPRLDKIGHISLLSKKIKKNKKYSEDERKENNINFCNVIKKNFDQNLTPKNSSKKNKPLSDITISPERKICPNKKKCFKKDSDFHDINIYEFNINPYKDIKNLQTTCKSKKNIKIDFQHNNFIPIFNVNKKKNFFDLNSSNLSGGVSENSFNSGSLKLSQLKSSEDEENSKDFKNFFDFDSLDKKDDFFN
jgi:hypothetical protein